jgi:hypothetical protein
LAIAVAWTTETAGVASAAFCLNLYLYPPCAGEYSRRIRMVHDVRLVFSRRFPKERLLIAIRVFAAVVGGYILTSSVVAALALVLPMQPAEAVLAATMVSFALYAGIALSVFAIRSVPRLAVGMLAAICILKAALWLAAGAT